MASPDFLNSPLESGSVLSSVLIVPYVLLQDENLLIDVLFSCRLGKL